MASPFLYFVSDRLSSAELSAASLDGHLVELGEGYIPADAVETKSLRGASLAMLLGEVLAATHLSAAWIHGALPDPPPRHTVQRAVPRRLHHHIGRRFQYRDPYVGSDDLDRVGGVFVTTPVRTLADLCRVSDEAHHRAARLMVASGVVEPREAIDWLERSAAVPHKRAALTLLHRWETPEGRPPQDDVTRYTS